MPELVAFWVELGEKSTEEEAVEEEEDETGGGVIGACLPVPTVGRDAVQGVFKTETEETSNDVFCG